jgi:hypothetical protein
MPIAKEFKTRGQTPPFEKGSVHREKIDGRWLRHAATENLKRPSNTSFLCMNPPPDFTFETE